MAVEVNFHCTGLLLDYRPMHTARPPEHHMFPMQHCPAFIKFFIGAGNNKSFRSGVTCCMQLISMPEEKHPWSILRLHFFVSADASALSFAKTLPGRWYH